MTPKSDIVAGSRTKVSDLESGYHNVLAMKIINIYLYKSHTNYNLSDNLFNEKTPQKVKLSVLSFLNQLY